MTDYSVHGLIGFSFVVVLTLFYWYLTDQKEKIDERNKEIAIAHNSILSFEMLTDKLIASDVLPEEAKNVLLFISSLLVDEREAKRFLGYIRTTMGEKKQTDTDNSLYEMILSRTKEFPQVLNDFNTAIRIGMTAVMFKCPHQSSIFFEALQKPLPETSAELDTIEKYKNNTSVKPDKFKLATC